jgi:DMSO/TMAO reductase YedYZ molybdopterin-dependent catalytic subunit
MRDDDVQASDDSKLTRTKRAWARDGKFLTGKISRPETDRLPPGQHLVKNWPVLDLGIQPQVPLSTWRLDVTGAVDNRLSLTWEAFNALPQSDFVTDIHCVTTWSRYDNRWQGVSTHDLLDRAMPAAEASHVLLTSFDGYTTNLPLSDFAVEDAILATHWEGAPITTEHGGPMRLIVPHLYLWKSAKWLRQIEFISADKAGYWERNGYHMRGDPWREERYSDD